MTIDPSLIDPRKKYTNQLTAMQESHSQSEHCLQYPVADGFSCSLPFSSDAQPSQGLSRVDSIVSLSLFSFSSRKYWSITPCTFLHSCESRGHVKRSKKFHKSNKMLNIFLEYFIFTMFQIEITSNEHGLIKTKKWVTKYSA